MRLSSIVCCSVGLPGLGWTAGRGQRCCDLRDMQQTWTSGNRVLAEHERNGMMFFQYIYCAGMEAEQKRALMDFKALSALAMWAVNVYSCAVHKLQNPDCERRWNNSKGE